ncbi:Bromodomain-containing protein [Pseudovirgaria hyperparasitica]|uniref:Bromodomain-containing protein n=1 Tax=Pseudovirgaria hyperparasitica TaxID=470096 RepID=A0A6A6WE90_9PEZI|nr:Bromodomain-containing protein [Pseudovirgaria hyperparasitica]KAF2760855.1 Bromodomain-containing protein [Pseudovirgaria hyperparasitica]
MAAERAPSDTPLPTTETVEPTSQSDAAPSTVSDEEWQAMQSVLQYIYDYRQDGEDPSKWFQRKVNKRNVPDYYLVIQEPMALSVIKGKINNKEYKNFAEFVRDFALIPFNAQVYNIPNSGPYQDALIIKNVLEAQLQKLVEQKIITEEVATLPYLGEIPTHDEVADGEEEDEEEDDEDEDEKEEDEDADESDEEGGRRKKRKGARTSTAIAKREADVKADAAEKAAAEAESRKKRGRPPRVDTPMEARIKNIMKAMRKPKNSQSQLMISAFERLPDKTTMPEYYVEIKVPMAMDVLKKKLKRKKYTSVDQFMKDVEIMFENAKSYNKDDSQIYQDAIHLQKEARDSAAAEKQKADTEFVMEDGRLPMPNGILHNGELWKVGDWVHIQNANDVTKPIVAQVYRTWQDQEGAKWVNACWYYRPEQTIHRFDRHFLENEVVKTGQYRDHPIEEVVDRCFVMFVTRYNKGRPRNFPADKEIYVCEARYNEEKHKLNKIKTWASCLPDEVREKDYEMDLFDVPKKMKKNPSPIAYLLADDAKETDDLPKPQWGAENAPPKIGAVHNRPRDPKDSPPPEPTPTPPPQPPPPPPRQISNVPAPQQDGYSNQSRRDYNMNISQTPIPAPTPTPNHHPQPAYTPSHHQHTYSQNAASPAQHMPQHPSPSQPPPVFPQLTPHINYAHQPAPMPHHSHATSHTPSVYQQRSTGPPQSMHSYQAPKAPEVWTLDTHANLTIPPEIREQFQRDAQGRVLFFTVPPLDVMQPEKHGAALGHSARYLAAKAKREQVLSEKRKRDAEAAKETEHERKKAKLEAESKALRDVTAKAKTVLSAIETELAVQTRKQYEELYGAERFQAALDVGLQRMAERQRDQAVLERAVTGRLEKEREADENSRRVRGLTTALVDGT